MKQGSFRRIGFWVFTLLVAILALTASRARADVMVRVTMFSLSPNPVYIVTGEAVFWTDADGGGPYGIYASSGSWSTSTDSYGIQFMQPGTYSYYDDWGDTGTIYVSVNSPPSLAIISPPDGSVFTAPANFNFAVAASDTDADGLSDVKFYVGTNLWDDVFSPPFTTAVTNLAAGNYTLTAIAYDNVGATATKSVSISVVDGTGAPKPSIVQVANQIVISWSTNNASGFTLQSTTNLTSNAVWTPVTTTPALVGSQLVVTNPMVGSCQFFRLNNH